MINQSSKQENRKFKRHQAKGTLEYNFAYDVRTRMEFQIEDQKHIPDAQQTYNALSKNLSVEGICFVSEKKLAKGTPLHLLVHIPESNEIVDMEGEVKWSRMTQEEKESANKMLFDTGIKLSEVNGSPVHETIHYDQLFKLQWSVVLESVFGRYRLVMDEKRKENTK